MGRQCGKAHEISGIPASLCLCGWVVGRFMGWVGFDVGHCGVDDVLVRGGGGGWLLCWVLWGVGGLVMWWGGWGCVLGGWVVLLLDRWVWGWVVVGW